MSTHSASTSSRTNSTTWYWDQSILGAATSAPHCSTWESKLPEYHDDSGYLSRTSAVSPNHERMALNICTSLCWHEHGTIAESSRKAWSSYVSQSFWTPAESKKCVTSGYLRNARWGLSGTEEEASRADAPGREGEGSVAQSRPVRSVRVFVQDPTAGLAPIGKVEVVVGHPLGKEGPIAGEAHRAGWEAEAAPRARVVFGH
eukprot:scaffold41434_cov63-Phaeocystis_antarctica.AAC.5